MYLFVCSHRTPAEAAKKENIAREQSVRVLYDHETLSIWGVLRMKSGIERMVTMLVP